MPNTPFHGGFGLMANGLIPKPTLWTFHFFNNLRGVCVHRDERLVLMRREDGSYEGVAWNLCERGEAESDAAMRLELRLSGEGPHALYTRVVDDDHGNPLKLWLAMGQPASLSAEQLDLLRSAARPGCGVSEARQTSEGIVARLTLAKNAVAHFRLLPSAGTPDFGYDPGMYL